MSQGKTRGPYRIRSRRFEYFSGILQRASMEILEVPMKANTQHETIYRVRNICCGKEALCSHMTIKARISAADRNGRGIAKCNVCTLKDSAKLAEQKPRPKAHKVDRRAPMWRIDNLWNPPPLALEIHRAGEWEPR